MPATAIMDMRPCLSSASRNHATSGLLPETLYSSQKLNGSHATGSSGAPGYAQNSTGAPPYSDKGLRGKHRNSFPMPSGAKVSSTT